MITTILFLHSIRGILVCTYRPNDFKLLKERAENAYKCTQKKKVSDFVSDLSEVLL